MNPWQQWSVLTYHGHDFHGVAHEVSHLTEQELSKEIKM
jgi:hypothetical protein